MRTVQNVEKKNTAELAIVFFGTALIIVLEELFSGIVPFGDKSLVWADADIQYLDFFAYYKDCLRGDNSFLYSFSKSLGGSCFGILSYYLLSPFNLISLFFKKRKLHLFFTIIVDLKLATAATTFYYYIRNRFDERWFDRQKLILIMLLSMCYGINQYTITQASNVMWLDGVYMLPLIMLGVYRLVKYGKGKTLVIAVGLSIIFNWYSAGIDCVFACLWGLFEVSLILIDSESSNINKIKLFFSKLTHFIFAMTAGVMLSAITFLPSVLSLSGTGKGSLQSAALFDMSLIGDIKNIAAGFVSGAISTKGAVSLFCGSFALLCCICLIVTNRVRISIRKRLLFLATLVITPLLFYWHPFVLAFSLFSEPDSYWYRYSYVGIIILLFFASYYVVCSEASDSRKASELLIAVAVTVVILAAGKAYIHDNVQRYWITSASVLLSGVLLSAFNKHSKNGTSVKVLFLIAALIIGENIYSSFCWLNVYHTEGVNQFASYVDAQEKQISDIRKRDKSLYRISQITTRNTWDNGHTANYDEAFAYNYYSIPSYTSIPDDPVMDFLDKSGYKKYAECINVVNTSILGVDTFVGAKYLLSPNPVKGYEPVDNANVYNGKGVYYNPNALSFAFTYSNNSRSINEANPFVYQNSLYSIITGEETDLYKPVHYEKQIGDNYIKYLIDVPENNCALYGNLPYNSLYGGTATISDSYQIEQASWLAPSVFYIPTDKAERDTVTVIAEAENAVDIKKGKEQFYALDIDKLRQVTRKISMHNAEIESFENGKVSINANAQAGENLFISVPVDSGWDIKVNGKEVKDFSQVGCMYSIPLNEGRNRVSMVYKVKGLNEGMVISIITLTCLIMAGMLEKRRKNRSKKVQKGEL